MGKADVSTDMESRETRVKEDEECMLGLKAR